MIEIYDKIYVGTQLDYENLVKGKSDWAIVHACKEPYHRQALGYTGRAVSKNHPEYLIARRGNRLIMNIVDVDNPMFFDKEKMMDKALDFLSEMYAKGLHLLIHCNQGESRGPSVALLFLATRLKVIPNATFEISEGIFKDRYPVYNPSKGIREHLRINWQSYLFTKPNKLGDI
jgi:hypothetical protein